MSSNKDSQLRFPSSTPGSSNGPGPRQGFIGVAVLRALLDYANHDTRLCWPSVGTLCTRTALSENSVLKGLRLLREHGFIKTSQRMEKGRRPPTSTIMDRELVAHEAPGQRSASSRSSSFSASDRAAAEGGGCTAAPHELNGGRAPKGVKVTVS